MSSGSDDCIQFTRHAGDVLFNFNQLRSRNILTDVTVLVGGREFKAHKTVLMVCSGFFYSMFIDFYKTDPTVVSLDTKADPDGFAILLEFMYTSCLTLKERYVVATLNTAIFLQMEHMVEACHRFMESRFLSVKSSSEEPAGFSNVSTNVTCHLRDRLPPVVHYAVSTSTSNPTRVYSRLSPQTGSVSNTKAPLWEIPNDVIVTQAPHKNLNSEMDRGIRQSVVRQVDGGDGTSLRVEERGLGHIVQSQFVDPRSPLRSDCQPNSPAESSGCSREASGSPKVHNWKKYKFIVLNKGPPPDCNDVTRSEEKCDQTSKDPTPFSTSTSTFTVRDEGDANCSEIRNDGSNAVPGEKPYRCNICNAQFNRPANLKTHLRIHSGEKPYKCDTCGSAFVQVAHLRAHVLIHTGEKPYSCSVCSTRFRHLQTLKSHLRIHTGEKPYHCENCDLRFRHKSQLRLHLRQKHGAVTNIRTSKR